MSLVINKLLTQQNFIEQPWPTGSGTQDIPALQQAHAQVAALTQSIVAALEVGCGIRGASLPPPCPLSSSDLLYQVQVDQEVFLTLIFVCRLNVAISRGVTETTKLASEPTGW